MGDYTCALSFRVKHSDRDLGDVPVQLGLSPKRIWKKGDPRSTPKGDKLDGVWKNSFCYFNFDCDDVDGLPGALENAVARLMPHKKFLNDLAGQGTQLAFFIGWFSDDLNWGEEFDWPLLRDLAELRVRLEFDVYGPNLNKAGPI